MAIHGKALDGRLRRWGKEEEGPQTSGACIINLLLSSACSAVTGVPLRRRIGGMLTNALGLVECERGSLLITLPGVPQGPAAHKNKRGSFHLLSSH